MRHHALLASGVAVAALLAMPASAADAPAADANATPNAEIVVLGRGQTRQVQELSKVDIAAAVPGTSPLKVLDKLPSVSFQSASPLGTNEWSTKISVRGFDQQHLGFTLDDVPLGDMNYANFNGLHISRAITSQNIGRTELSQGAGALSTASSSNLGGTIRFFSMDPSDQFAIDTEATYGSENAWTAFARVQTGDLGGGVKAYVSGSYVDAPKWKGKGAQHAWTINSKIVAPFGDGGMIKAFVNYSDWKDDDYIDMERGSYHRQGYDVDYIRYDWATAIQLASIYNTSYCGSFSGYGALCGDDTYYDGYGLRKDLLMGANISYKLSDALSVKITPYYHHDRGIGTWWAPQAELSTPTGPIGPSPTGTPISVRATSYAIDREGLTGGLTYHLANHTFEVGGWYEHNKFRQALNVFALDNTDHSSIGPREWPKDPYFKIYDYSFKINTYQYYVQDTWQLTPDFKITGGWKGLEVAIDSHLNRADADVNGTPSTYNPNGSLKSKDFFMPQVGANYQFSNQLEAFADYAENMRAFDPTPFITTQAQFNTAKANGLKPETSWTAEGGFRFHLPHFEGSVAGYHVKFSNRLYSVSANAGAASTAVPTLTNVGGVTTNGAEIAGTYRFTRALSLYGSYAYTSAHYDDDVYTRTATPTLVTASGGKSVVDLPKHLINGELAYDDGQFSARVHVNYQSKRYAVYDNTLSFAGRALVDLSLGYKIRSGGPLDGTQIQLNVTNIFSKKYVATIGETGGYKPTFVPGSTYQYYLVGAPAQAFITIKKSF